MMRRSDPQPGFGLLVKLSNGQCRQPVNAITASHECSRTRGARLTPAADAIRTRVPEETDLDDMVVE
jgi:hypothetical protein